IPGGRPEDGAAVGAERSGVGAAGGTRDAIAAEGHLAAGDADETDDVVRLLALLVVPEGVEDGGARPPRPGADPGAVELVDRQLVAQHVGGEIRAARAVIHRRGVVVRRWWRRLVRSGRA